MGVAFEYVIKKELMTTGTQKNVLMSDNGHALIADFGISYLLISKNPASTRLSDGSTRWMAPELLIMGCTPTLQSDVWSFGCVCYEVRLSYGQSDSSKLDSRSYTRC